jgi:hypothetical protein
MSANVIYKGMCKDNMNMDQYKRVLVRTWKRTRRLYYSHTLIRLSSDSKIELYDVKILYVF